MKAPCGIEISLLVAATLAVQDVVRVDLQHYKCYLRTRTFVSSEKEIDPETSRLPAK